MVTSRAYAARCCFHRRAQAGRLRVRGSWQARLQRGQTARVFEVAKRWGCRLSCTPTSSHPGGANLAAATTHSPPIICNITDDAGAAAMAKAGTVAVLLPGAFYFIRETQKPPVELFRKHGTRIAIATDSNPGSSPLTSLLLTMNMAATLFRRRSMRSSPGDTRPAAHALGRSSEVGTLKPANGAISPSGTSSVWRSCPIAWGSIRCTSGYGEASDLRRRSGEPGRRARKASANGAHIEGAAVTLDPACVLPWKQVRGR